MPSEHSGRRELIHHLLRSPEPSIRWRTRTRVLGESRDSQKVRNLEKVIRSSRRVRGLLTHQFARFRPGTSRSIYHYWQGIHWALASLADLGYPPADEELRVPLDRALGFWTKAVYRRSVRVSDHGNPHPHGVPIVRGRARRCASQQGNALLYASRLGESDSRADLLARLLVGWQWPDGGWNCDRRPEADSSSFMETLTPMRGLAAHASATGSKEARKAAERAAEVFLQRRLFRRRSDGGIIEPSFLQLHYPLYWYYDILGGLKGIAEVGRIDDPRCAEALDLLEKKELRQGGWPLEARLFKVSPKFEHRAEYVDWGAPGGQVSNDWVTTDALYVLKEAGRLAS